MKQWHPATFLEFFYIIYLKDITCKDLSPIIFYLQVFKSYHFFTRKDLRP